MAMTIRRGDVSPHQQKLDEQVVDPGVGRDDASGARGAVAGGVSRRSVVKAGAAAAWSVPLIQVVAAAPANAAYTSGTQTTLQWQSLSAAYKTSDSSKLDVTVSIKNSGTFSASSVQVVVELPAGLAGASVNEPSGWTRTAGSTSFSFAKAAVAADATDGFTVTFSLPNAKGNSFDLNATASAGNATTVASPPVTVAAATSAITFASWRERSARRMRTTSL